MISIIIMLIEIRKETKAFQSGKVYIASYEKVMKAIPYDIALQVVPIITTIILAFR